MFSNSAEHLPLRHTCQEEGAPVLVSLCPSVCFMFAFLPVHLHKRSLRQQDDRKHSIQMRYRSKKAGHKPWRLSALITKRVSHTTFLLFVCLRVSKRRRGREKEGLESGFSDLIRWSELKGESWESRSGGAEESTCNMYIQKRHKCVFLSSSC